MKEKINVVAVSYLNTLPFIFGILNDKDLMSQINLRLEYPSKCSDLLKSGEVDFAGADSAAGAIDEPTGRIPKESLEKVGRYIYEHKMANGKVPVEAIKKAAAYLKMQQAK